MELTKILLATSIAGPRGLLQEEYYLFSK